MGFDALKLPNTAHLSTSHDQRSNCCLPPPGLDGNISLVSGRAAENGVAKMRHPAIGAVVPHKPASSCLSMNGRVASTLISGFIRGKTCCNVRHLPIHAGKGWFPSNHCDAEGSFKLFLDFAFSVFHALTHPWIRRLGYPHVFTSVSLALQLRVKISARVCWVWCKCCLEYTTCRFHLFCSPTSQAGSTRSVPAVSPDSTTPAQHANSYKSVSKPVYIEQVSASLQVVLAGMRF